jgi:hypothetical protein
MSRALSVAFFGLASAAKDNLDARLHALSSKITKLELPECDEDYAQCKDWCHSNGMAWESKCDSDYHCCSGCPRCLETGNLLPAAFMMQSADNTDYCLHAEGGTLDEDTPLVWSSGCGGAAALKFSALDAGNGNFVLHITADNNQYGDSTFCVHPATLPITSGDGLVVNTDCSVKTQNMQFKPIWEEDSFTLQSMSDDSFCVHSSGGSVSDGAELIFRTGCSADKLKFKAMES